MHNGVCIWHNSQNVLMDIKSVRVSALFFFYSFSILRPRPFNHITNEIQLVNPIKLTCWLTLVCFIHLTHHVAFNFSLELIVLVFYQLLSFRFLNGVFCMKHFRCHFSCVSFVFVLHVVGEYEIDNSFVIPSAAII